MKEKASAPKLYLVKPLPDRLSSDADLYSMIKKNPDYAAHAGSLLFENETSTQLRAFRALAKCVIEKTDIGAALPKLETALREGYPWMRKCAAIIIWQYGLGAYKVDCRKGWPELARELQNSEKYYSALGFAEKRKTAPVIRKLHAAAAIAGVALIIPFSSANVLAPKYYDAIKTGTQRTLEAVMEKNALAEPAYFSGGNRFISQDKAIFSKISEHAYSDGKFQGWFSSISEQEKRGFVLYIGSRAISSHIKNTEEFGEGHWNAYGNISSLAAEYLGRTPLAELMTDYEEMRRKAQAQREIFLERNRWLSDFLGEKYSDFEEGLLYFLMEHQYTTKEIVKKAESFAKLRKKISLVSHDIIDDRENYTRVSPGSGASDAQVREIVAAAALGQAFYSVNARVSIPIFAWESNFEMKSESKGDGVSQITGRASVMALHSGYWRERVRNYSGAPVRMQLANRNLLNNNVFSNVMEGVKSITLKCAEDGMPTSELTKGKNAYRIAHQYNLADDPKRYARNVYAMVSGTDGFGSEWTVRLARSGL